MREEELGGVCRGARVTLTCRPFTLKVVLINPSIAADLPGRSGRDFWSGRVSSLDPAAPKTVPFEFSFH